MSTLAKIVVTTCLSALCFSCNITGISGKGEVIRKEKTIQEDFQTIKASRGLHVILMDSDDKNIIVEANENLHDHIKVYVKEGVLFVTTDKNIYRADEKNVFVSYQKLSKISATSGANITSEEALVQKELSLSATSGSDIQLRIKAEILNTSLTSGASINISGKVNIHNASATSGANLRAEDLLSLVTEARATSGSSIKIHAKKEFSGKATSGASVNYFGNPEKVTKKDNSGGNVSKR